ncbi:trigger factor [Rickettsia prowazekii]|uniref:Trigger factor n=2 Tax=Rickettsia prowazekii TaxID=782 RepID=TIG_RICPR|nr:trigger factor [Rickettsia prowazekii]Q9ZCB7.1 RecName: Full=Trigger factor; Short=TF; AltName: Full=PPIase [Rickettsia prowazekii str. Madrid E]ADE30418.1 Trigger factor [Rickettsia prowazekii str. Rp22]AFE49636.1 trigger factor [Rickettsia prowazekii str. Chernikova]AFE50480.1 trigger factor [Rickettsia prowazekii str. Katsinyian]AFE51323.1 trigger factor [Rickettsia prowazekii str. BuV67-CWPP]AFE52161.1 trigger factor [Rickettsia prowazekii str. Dachau]
MGIIVLKNEGLNFHARISTPLSEIDDDIQKELLDLTKKVKVAGFRAGKVPVSIVKKKYGTSVRHDIIEKRINNLVNHIIKEYNLNIIGRPKIEELQNEPDKDLEFTVKIELLPKITIPDLKKISLDRPKLAVNSQDVEIQLEKLAALTKCYTKESKTKIKDGDQVTIDAIGYIKDRAFDGGKLNDFKVVIGSNTLIQGFEQQLIGSKTGNEVDVNVTFPENYHDKNLSGKDAHFVVQIKAVHTAEPTIIDEEFAKKFQSNSLEELRTHFAKQIENESEEAINTIMKMNLFDKLEKLLDFDVPESLLEQEKNILKSETDKNKHDGSLLNGKSSKEITEYYNKLALRRVRIGLLLAEYAKFKNLQLEPDDFKKIIMQQARNFPGQENMIFDFYKNNPRAIEGLKGPALEDKTVQYIFNNEIQLKEKRYTKEELEKYLETEEQRISLI